VVDDPFLEEASRRLPVTPPRVVPDPRRWPHPLTALRRWARRWLGIDDDLIASLERDTKLTRDLTEAVKRDRVLLALMPDSRYPVQLHDGRCLRPCCADLDEAAFADAFRRVSGEDG